MRGDWIGCSLRQRELRRKKRGQQQSENVIFHREASLRASTSVMKRMREQNIKQNSAPGA